MPFDIKPSNIENHNRSTALIRSVILKLLKGLNRFSGISTSPSAIAVVQNIEMGRLVRMMKLLLVNHGKQINHAMQYLAIFTAVKTIIFR